MRKNSSGAVRVSAGPSYKRRVASTTFLAFLFALFVTGCGAGSAPPTSTTTSTPSLAFATIPAQTYGSAPFTVTATSASIGAVTYSVASGPATISGDTVTLTGVGTVVLNASQAASGSYGAATTQTSFAVTAATPTLAFAAIPAQTYGNAPFAVTATSASTGAVTYSVASGPATISGNTVTLTGVGTVTLSASQAASGNYGPATAQTSFTVTGATPSLAFAAIPAQTFGAQPFAVSATSTSTGAVTYAVVSGPASISGNIVTLSGAGTVVLSASQTAAGNYGPATAQTSFTVTAATPSLAFTAIPAQTFGAQPFAVNASSASTGTVTYAVVSGPATISGNTVTLSGAGTVVLSASQAAAGNYGPATAQTSFPVLSANPKLAFGAVPAQTFGAQPFAVSATSASSGVVTYSVVSGPALISGNTVTLTGVGTVTLAASQAAAPNYSAAVTQTSFTVLPGTPTLTFAAIPTQSFGSGPLQVHASSPSNGTVTYSVTGPATISGTTVTITGTGAVTVTAQQAATDAYIAARSSITFTVQPAAPTLAFAPIASQTYGASPIQLRATSGSDGQVTYAVVSGPATLSGSTMTLTGTGTVVLSATQAATTNYGQATAQITFTVSPATPVLIWNVVPGKTFGDAPFPVSASSSSPAPITYTVVSGPGSVSGSTVTITGIGNIVIAATQSSTPEYASANAQLTVPVSAATPNLVFAPVPAKIYGAAPFSVSASSESSGPVTYSSVSGPATVAGTIVTINGVGTVVLAANQTAAGNYGAATAQTSFTVAASTTTNLLVGPPSLSFASTSIGATTPSQTVVLSNATATEIPLSSITIVGSNPGDFSQTNTCGPTLAPYSSCTVAVTFTPAGTSVRSASLSVTSAMGASPQLVALSGTGYATVFNGAHAAVDSTEVHPYPGASYDVTLSNPGSAPLAVTSIALENTPFNTQTNNCPSSLASGASCVITIHSIAVGADQLVISTNDQTFSSNIPVFQPPSLPTSVFTPSDVFFADTPVGSTATYNYVYNPNWTVSPVISGPQASDFKATTPICTQGNYPQTGPSCTFSVKFTPSASGFRSAKLALDSSGNYLPLAGIGTAGSSVKIVSFPFLDFTYYPIPQGGTLSNTGTIPISTSGIQFQSITGPAEFTQSNDCGNSLAPGASCTLHVSSTRLTEGGTQALLTVSAGTESQTLLLDNSLYPVLNFGPTSYGSTTGQHAAYPILDAFNNNGYSTMFQTFLANAPWQSFTFAGCSTTSGTCVGQFNFNPTQSGIQTGNATVANSGIVYPPATGTSVRQYIVVGTGVATEPAAKLILQQSGFVAFGGPSQSGHGTLTLINPGVHTLSLSAPAMSGSAPEKFTFGQPSCAQPSSTQSSYTSMAEGTQCTIPITLDASRVGFSTAVATVTDSTSGLSFSLPLYLESMAGISASPSSLTFPGTSVFSVSAPQSVTVDRTSTHPVTTSTSGGLVATKGTCAAGEVPCTLTFVFAPTNISDSPTATIYDGSVGISTSLTVSGKALALIVNSSESASPGSLSFAAQRVGTASTPQAITLKSGGPEALTIYSALLSGTNANEFLETINCPAVLAVNATCTINVALKPLTPGYKSAAITIKDSSNPGNPRIIQLSGSTQ